MDSNLIGCIAEYKFAAEAMERGFLVSFPLLDSSPYDCIVETKEGFKKIQIKSVVKKEKFARCYLRKSVDDPYNIKDVDYFAIFVEHHNGFYIIKNDGKVKNFYLSKEGIYKNNFNNFVFH